MLNVDDFFKKREKNNERSNICGLECHPFIQYISCLGMEQNHELRGWGKFPGLDSNSLVKRQVVTMETRLSQRVISSMKKSF